MSERRHTKVKHGTSGFHVTECRHKTAWRWRYIYAHDCTEAPCIVGYVHRMTNVVNKVSLHLQQKFEPRTKRRTQHSRRAVPHWRQFHINEPANDKRWVFSIFCDRCEQLLKQMRILPRNLNRPSHGPLFFIRLYYQEHDTPLRCKTLRRGLQAAVCAGAALPKERRTTLRLKAPTHASIDITARVVHLLRQITANIETNDQAQLLVACSVWRTHFEDPHNLLVNNKLQPQGTLIIENSSEEESQRRELRR